MNVLAQYIRIKGNIRTLLEDNLAYAAISFYCTFLPSYKTWVSDALPNLNLKCVISAHYRPPFSIRYRMESSL